MSIKLKSTAPNDSSVYTLDKDDHANIKGVLKAVADEGLDLANPDAFDFEVTVLEDGEPGVYAARLTRHSGWGLWTEIHDRKVWFEFCRSGRA